MTMTKPSKMKKTRSFFMVWLRLSKVEKGNRKKQTMECKCHRFFFQKIEIGRQNGCKFFQNDHVKAIKNEKNGVLFMVWLRL
jgi:hypothetical protein